MVNVIIEPFEPLVEKAIRLIENDFPQYFSGVNKIILEPGSPNHFGRVKSEQPDTIFVSLDKIKSFMSNADELDVIKQIAGTLAHEMGHLNSDFQGGEAPAEQEEAEVMNRLRNKTLASMYERKFIKEAFVPDYSSPDTLSDSLLRIISHFSQKVKPENRQKYIMNISNRILDVSPNDIASRQKNPGGGVGSTISLVKNLLAGQPFDLVNNTLSMLKNKIDRL